MVSSVWPSWGPFAGLPLGNWCPFEGEWEDTPKLGTFQIHSLRCWTEGNKHFSWPHYTEKTEWFELEETLKIILFHPLPPAQAAPSPVLPGLEHCQGGGSHSFSGQPGPGPHHPQSEEFLPYIQFKSPLFQFKAITPCPITPCPCQKTPLALL